MKSTKQPKPRFRVGDWVAVLYGPKMVLAQVVEDRGPLAAGKQVYRIRIDFTSGEPTYVETREEFLEPTTEADRAAWEEKQSIAIHQPVSYKGSEQDRRGWPKPFHHYLILGKPGPQPGSGTASIICTSEARYAEEAPATFPRFAAEEGGPDAAIAQAEAYLDALPIHRGLNKSVGQRRA